MKYTAPENPPSHYTAIRILLFCGLFVFSSLAFAVKSSLAAAAPELGGKWKVHNSIAGNENDQECTFTQNGKELTGTCKSDSDKDPVKVTGSLDGNKVTWKYDSDYNGTKLTLIYTATVEDSAKFSGTVEVQPFGVTGEFTSTKVK